MQPYGKLRVATVILCLKCVKGEELWSCTNTEIEQATSNMYAVMPSTCTRCILD